MGLFWPAQRKAQPSAIERLGRVLHWLAVIIGVAISGIAFWGMIATPSPNAQVLFLVALIFAIAVSLAGRALRYIFSGE